MEETYDKFIQNILETRGRFACGEEYHERHHILPKCMGGNNEEDNLIDLFAREHFIAHKMLALEHPDNDGLTYAWGCMAFPTNRSQKRYELTPAEYEETRKALSAVLSGRTLSEETRNKIREKAMGRVTSEETRQKLSVAHSEQNNYWFGKHPSQETRDKMNQSQKERLKNPENNPMYGRPWWDENTPQEKIDEWKANISKRTSGKNNPNYGVKCTEDKRSKLIQSNPNTKAVVHIDINGEILGDYRSKREANRLTGINRRLLEYYCLGKKQPSDGTRWMFKVVYEQEYT